MITFADLKAIKANKGAFVSILEQWIAHVGT